VDGKVLLKCILKGYDLRTLTGLVWLEMKWLALMNMV
jgi:hypothetical protein